MSDKLTRTIQRFQSKIDNGEFYEAHQTLRTITNRYVKSKNFKQSTDLLYQGSIILSNNQQFSSSSDLILYFIEIINEDISIYDKDIKLQLIEMISKLPNNEPSLIEISKKAIQLTKIIENSNFGDYEFHNLFGLKFLNNCQKSDVIEREKVFQLSELHLILGNSQSLNHYIDFLFKWYLESGKSSQSSVDPGIFISRAIINYAYLKNIQYAKESLNKFLSLLINQSNITNYEILKTDNGTNDFYYFNDFKILNFLQLLVITLSKQDNGNKFLKLYQNYKTDLIDLQLLNSIEYLGRFYYNLKLGNPNNQNMLANLMSGLFK